MKKIILHIDFNSYFASVEQQANPRLRGKPIGVTGGDRLKRTVVGAASVEAKKLGVYTGMSLGEALKICPSLILVRGDSDKYLECTKRFLNILKNFSPYMEIFSIDEVFLELPNSVIANPKGGRLSRSYERQFNPSKKIASSEALLAMTWENAFQIAKEIKVQIKRKIGEWVTVSIGISYNKRMAKLAGSLYKPNGLVVIKDEEAAQFILDRVKLDDICGIGFRIKRRLNSMGINTFADLRIVPEEALIASFKSYGKELFNMARGIDHTPLVPFYLKEGVKSVGHRYTLNHDTSDPLEVKQILLKLTELIARKLRHKKLVGKTVSLWFRYAFYPARGGVDLNSYQATGIKFFGDGMQTTVTFTDDGLEIFKASYQSFLKLWDQGPIRMVGVSISNLQSQTPQNLSLLDLDHKHDRIMNALDKINDRYGEFTLKRAVLVGTPKISRKPNSFLADRRFKI
jgi:DNA polymerase IV